MKSQRDEYNVSAFMFTEDEKSTSKGNFSHVSYILFSLLSNTLNKNLLPD